MPQYSYRNAWILRKALDDIGQFGVLGELSRWGFILACALSVSYLRIRNTIPSKQERQLDIFHI